MIQQTNFRQTSLPDPTQIKDTSGEIQRLTSVKQLDVGLILGSGWNRFAESIEEETELPLGRFPHFPKPCVAGHSGKLVCGRLGGKRIAALCGRRHLYEGALLAEVLFPVAVFQALGANVLGLTNAAGTVNPEFQVGQIMIIRDHVDTTWHRWTAPLSPLATGISGKKEIEVYEPSLAERLMRTGKELSLPVCEGVYACVMGPFYETPSEIRCLGDWGCDAVGMSTVPEATYGRLQGMKVFGLSALTNLGTGLATKSHSHAEVQRQAERLAPLGAELLGSFLESLPQMPHRRFFP